MTATRIERVKAGHVITVSPHIRPDGTKHPNAFDARLAGSDAVVCVSETPLFTSARVLLARGMAQPDDTIIMRHAGSEYDALRAKVGVAAELTIAETGSGPRRIKYRPYSGPSVALRIEQTPSLAPEAPADEREPVGASGESSA